MKNYINYKGLNKSELGLIKFNQLKHRNIDTIILEENKYWDDVENKYDELKNIKNFIIVDKIINKHGDNSIVIQNTRAENIFFKNQANLGGLTLPIEYLKVDVYLQWFNNFPRNLKEINLIFPKKMENIQLDEGTYKIELFVRNYDINKSFMLKIYDKYKDIIYFGDTISGITDKQYDRYTYTNKDIKDGILDLRNIDENSTYSNLDVNTIIIKKEDLFNSKLNYEFDEKISVKELIIIDQNEMKLNPEIKINFDGLIEIYNYFITNGEKTKFMYLDKNSELKVLDKDELLKNENIEDVEFIINSECELLLIKYKNKTFKIIDENKEYLIDELFGDYLYLNINSYDFYEEEKPFIKKYIIDKEWKKLFIDKIIDNNILYCIYDDYLKFIERIKDLKKLGFKDIAIKYLISRKYDNIINTKSKNILDIKEIGDHEVKLFNYISDKIEIKNNVVLKKLKK